MQKIIARVLLVPYIFSSIISLPLVHAAGTFDVTMYGADVSANKSTWNPNNNMRPGEYVRMASAGTNNTSATGTSVQINFSNAAGDNNYTSIGVTLSTPSKFYIDPIPGLSGANTGLGFNPPVQNYGTFPQDLPPGSIAFAYRYGFQLNQNYTSPTFVPTTSFSGVGLPKSGRHI